VPLGGDAPVAVQSMTNTPTADIQATLSQIRALATAGADIVRVAIPDEPAALAFPALVADSPVPLVADVHFDHLLALAALRAGKHVLVEKPMTRTLAEADDLVAVAAGSALGTACVAVDRWLAPSGPGSAMLWFGLAGFASASAFVLDEAAAAVVDAVPRTLRWRTARRLAVGLVPLACWLVATGLVDRSASALSWPALAVTGTGVVSVALGASAALRRSGNPTPGDVVAAAVGGGTTVLVLVAVPDIGLVLEGGDPSTRATAWWLLVSVVGAGLVAWGSADPAAGHRRPRRAAAGHAPRRSALRQPREVLAALDTDSARCER